MMIVFSDPTLLIKITFKKLYNLIELKMPYNIIVNIWCKLLYG